MGSIFFHPKVSIALIVLVNQITTYALLLCHFLLFGYSRKDNIISKERRLIREREMSWQFVNLHPKMYFTKYCFIRNTYYIVLYIICISFECVLVIDWLLLHIYLLGIGTDTDIHVCISYVFQYLQSMIMHMPQEYRHLILPDIYYFDVSILPERGLRYISPKTQPIWPGDFHETSPNSMWAFYTSYWLTLTKKIFRLKAPFPRSQKRRTLWDFWRFSEKLSWRSKLCV